jgi:hypothetical protein
MLVGERIGTMGICSPVSRSSNADGSRNEKSSSAGSSR